MRKAGEVNYVNVHASFRNEGEVDFFFRQEAVRAVKMLDNHVINVMVWYLEPRRK